MRSGLTAAAQVSLLLLGLSAIFELIPLAVALDLLWLPKRPLRERLTRALRPFPEVLAARRDRALGPSSAHARGELARCGVQASPLVRR